MNIILIKEIYVGKLYRKKLKVKWVRVILLKLMEFLNILFEYIRNEEILKLNMYLLLKFVNFFYGNLSYFVLLV